MVKYFQFYSLRIFFSNLVNQASKVLQNEMLLWGINQGQQNHDTYFHNTHRKWNRFCYWWICLQTSALVFLDPVPWGSRASSHLRSQITESDTWKPPVDIDLRLCILKTSIISTSCDPYGFFTRVRSDSWPFVRIEVHRLNDVLLAFVELQWSKSHKTGPGLNKLLTYQGKPFRNILLTGWMRHPPLIPYTSLVCLCLCESTVIQKPPLYNINLMFVSKMWMCIRFRPLYLNELEILWPNCFTNGSGVRRSESTHCHWGKFRCDTREKCTECQECIDSSVYIFH